MAFEYIIDYITVQVCLERLFITGTSTQNATVKCNKLFTIKYWVILTSDGKTATKGRAGKKT